MCILGKKGHLSLEQVGAHPLPLYFNGERT